LKGVDYDALQTTDSIHYNFTAPITSIGNLVACTAITEFVSYQIDGGTPKVLYGQIQETTQGGGTATHFTISAFGSNDYLNINGVTIQPGTYTTANNWSMTLDGSTFFDISSQTTNTMVFQLNNFGAIGQYIDMTFNGTYQDAGGTTRTLNGVAHVKRAN
jgi:hypothetical protein